MMDKSAFLELLETPTDISNVMQALNMPYYRVRKSINALYAQGLLKRVKIGSKFLYHLNRSINKVTVGEPAVRSPPIG